MTALHISMVIPKQTPLNSPTQYQFVISPMIIQKVSIGFPLGCVDLVHVWVEYRAARLFPANDEGYFAANGQIITFDTQTYCVQPPYFLTVKGYNEDEKFQHRIWINFNVQYLTLEPQVDEILAAPNANFPHSRA